MILCETERTILKRFDQDCISETYLSWFMDSGVCKHTSHGLSEYTKGQAEDFVEESNRKGDVVCAINCDGKHIGNAALQDINNINRNAEFAIIIGEKDYWGKGYGTEVAKALFNYGFNKLNLYKIWLGTTETNKGMITIAQKLSMFQEGVFKRHVFLGGKYVDVIRYGIFKTQWGNDEI